MLDRLLDREQGYVFHPEDPGGETNYGISKRSFPEEDIKNLTPERAKQIYRTEYVDKFRIADIKHPGVAEQVLDLVVNAGQRGLRALQRELGVTADGVVGPATLEQLNKLTSERPVMHAQLRYYGRITKHPFIVGWINRLIKMGL